MPVPGHGAGTSCDRGYLLRVPAYKKINIGCYAKRYGGMAGPYVPLCLLGYGKDSTTLLCCRAGHPPKVVISTSLISSQAVAHLGVNGILVPQSKNAVAKDFGISAVLDVCCGCSSVSVTPPSYCMELAV
jgi:hypothetical protein